MNEMNELLEKEELIKDSNNLKNMTENIITAHRCHKQQIIDAQVAHIKEEFLDYIKGNSLSLEDTEVLRKFMIFQINNVVKGE